MSGYEIHWLLLLLLQKQILLLHHILLLLLLLLVVVLFELLLLGVGLERLLVHSIKWSHSTVLILHHLLLNERL
jgi:hypothetical protein